MGLTPLPLPIRFVSPALFNAHQRSARLRAMLATGHLPAANSVTFLAKPALLSRAQERVYLR